MNFSQNTNVQPQQGFLITNPTTSFGLSSSLPSSNSDFILFLFVLSFFVFKCWFLESSKTFLLQANLSLVNEILPTSASPPSTFRTQQTNFFLLEIVREEDEFSRSSSFFFFVDGVEEEERLQQPNSTQLTLCLLISQLRNRRAGLITEVEKVSPGLREKHC